MLYYKYGWLPKVDFMEVTVNNLNRIGYLNFTIILPKLENRVQFWWIMTCSKERRGSTTTILKYLGRGE